MLTNKEKRFVLKAAELIETEEVIFCCSALEIVLDNARVFDGNLTRAFADFYNKQQGTNWYPYEELSWNFYNAKDKRVMLLLTFAQEG